MGLDIYFEKRNRNYDKQEEYDAARKELDDLYDLPTDEFESHKDEVAELRQKVEDLNPRTEVAYFRKVNFLMVFFSYEGNCEYVEVTKGEIEELVDECNRVLENHELAEELLPTTSGFFFGSTEYDDWYFEDVEDVRDKFTAILNDTDWENEVVEMYCWW